MKVLEKNAVYDNNDNIIGFQCEQCLAVVPSMLGDICNECERENNKEKDKKLCCCKRNCK